ARFEAAVRHDWAEDLHRAVLVGGRAITQLAGQAFAHAPKAAVGGQEKAVLASGGNRRDASGHDLLRPVGIEVWGAVTQLAADVVAHGPEAAVGLDKQVVVVSGGNRRHAARLNLNRPVGESVDVTCSNIGVAQLAF